MEESGIGYSNIIVLQRFFLYTSGSLFALVVLSSVAVYLPAVRFLYEEMFQNSEQPSLFWRQPLPISLRPYTTVWTPDIYGLETLLDGMVYVQIVLSSKESGSTRTI